MTLRNVQNGHKNVLVHHTGQNLITVSNKFFEKTMSNCEVEICILNDTCIGCILNDTSPVFHV